MISSNIATDPTTGRQVIVANFETFRKQLEENIDKSCNEFLNEPDWNKNFEIYDSLNRTAYLCPFAVAAIRRKLKTKNPEIEILALHLLEGMIKNVPSSHGAVAQPSFMRYLIKVGMDTRKDGVMKSIGKKLKGDNAVNSAHFRAQAIDKALLIIQMLNNAYENSTTYPIFADTYKQLKKQGVRFPVLTKDEDATVFAPMHSNRFANYGKGGASGGAAPPSAMGSLSQSAPVVTAHANIDRSLPMIRPVVLLADLYHNDLKTAQENAKFFFEMVNASEPGSNLFENDLLQQLYTSTKEWQQRVQTIIQDPNCNEVVMYQGVAVNDLINNTLEDYNGLLTGTHRRYEEPLGDIENLKDKDNHDDTDDDKIKKSDAKTDDDDDEEGSNARKSVSLQQEDQDLGIAPPPADEGGKTHHARRLSRKRSVKNRNSGKAPSKHNAKNSQGDLLDLFDANVTSNDESNGIRKNPPHLATQPSAMGIFDLMAIPSGPQPISNGVTQGGSMALPENSEIGGGMGTMASAATTNNNNNASSGFDTLGDPFGGSPPPAAKPSAPPAVQPAPQSAPSGGAANPFDMFGGNPVSNIPSAITGNNNNNNNNTSKTSSNPFGLSDDPFASLSANKVAVPSGLNAPVKKNDDFMGGGDNPFDMFGGGGASNNNTNATNNNGVNNKKDDFMGGDASNPFAGL